MLNKDLSRQIDVFNATEYTAAGTSTITSAEYALSPNFDSLLAIAKVGTAAADNTLGINGATASGGSFSLLGTAVASGSNKLIVKEIKNIQHGWVKSVLTRGTSTTIEFVLLIAYNSKSGHELAASTWTTVASYNLQVAPTAA